MTPTEKAAEGLRLLEEAVMTAVEARPEGFYNSELARALGLESSYEGRHDNYLTYSVLGGLLSRGLVTKEKRDGRWYFVVPRP